MRDISMHILDIGGNSVRAGASLVEVFVQEDTIDDKLLLTVIDDGCGMNAETMAKAIDPYFTSRKTRKVGMGIPLLQHNAQQSDGYISIQSELGKGTVIKATFVRSHIDRPPMGDLPGTLSLMVSGNPQVDFRFVYKMNHQEYVLDSREVKKVLDGVEITHPSVVSFLKQIISENLQQMGVEFC